MNRSLLRALLTVLGLPLMAGTVALGLILLAATGMSDLSALGDRLAETGQRAARETARALPHEPLLVAESEEGAASAVLFEQLMSLADATGVTLSRVGYAGAEVQGSLLLHRIDISFTAPEGPLYDFLIAIDGAEPLLDVTRMDLQRTGDAGEIAADLSVTAYGVAP